jgi:hypothetical protein
MQLHQRKRITKGYIVGTSSGGVKVNTFYLVNQANSKRVTGRKFLLCIPQAFSLAFHFFMKSDLPSKLCGRTHKDGIPNNIIFGSGLRAKYPQKYQTIQKGVQERDEEIVIGNDHYDI